MFLDVEYKYEVDQEKDSKLSINVDMTIAMQCNLIGADVLDIWGQDIGKCKPPSNFFCLKEKKTNYKKYLILKNGSFFLWT